MMFENYTRFECIFTSSPLVSSVVLQEMAMDSNSVVDGALAEIDAMNANILNIKENIKTSETTPETSGEDVKLHSKRVEKM